jgi:cation transport ATPase
MDCADEAALIRHALARPGIVSLSFDLVGRRVDVVYDAQRISPPDILDAVASTGLTAHTHAAGDQVGDDHAHHQHHHHTAKWWAVTSGAFLAIGWIVDGIYSDSWVEAVFGNHGEDGHAHHSAAVATYAASAMTGLWPMLPRAFASLRFRRLDMHVLVCLSAIGAAAIGQWAEAATVAFLFALAHLMEAWSIDRARHAVATLVGHEPGWGADGGHETAPVERWIERFAAVYTPVVTLLALAVALVPPLVDGQWSVWFYRGLIFLVLACPCALVISTPVTVVAALTSAARRGVLFKGGAPLERVAMLSSPTLAGVRQLGVVFTREQDLRFLVNHARRTLRVIRQNVAIALATKVAFLISAALGASPLWLAVAADTGATVVVTLNGLRLLRTKS